jgi:hypothetical protein
MLSFLVRSSLCLSLLVPAVGFTFTDTTCSAPVCSVQDTMAELRAMTGDQRGMFALNLKNKYKDSTDEKILMNLRDSGVAFKTLFQELGDEDWVQRAANDLITIAVFNLAKMTTNGEELVEYYKDLATQTYRYNLISHWQSKLAGIEDLAVLQELIVFADGARSHSTTIADEDWVPRAASSLLSDITMKLTHLDPAHEGLYKIDQGYEKPLNKLSFDRIAVLDSSSSKNLVVVFMNTRLKVIVHSFSQAEIMGNTIKGLSLSNGDSATRFSFELNRTTGQIAGTMESTNDIIQFTGTQLESTRSVFAGKPSADVSKKDILGALTGEMGGVKGKLTIRSFQENVYSATFTSENKSIILNFQGKFYPQNAVLSLTSEDKVKLTLSLRDSEWKGFSFSTTTGTSSKAVFSQVK